MSYKYNKQLREMEINCPVCCDLITFRIPKSVLEREYPKYPFTFRYIHGSPPHSCTLYIDKNGVIRGHEFGDSISLSNEVLDEYFEEKSICRDSSTEEILKTIINIFYFTIETSLPNSDEIKFNVGKRIGRQLAKLFKSTDIQGLMEELKEFWREHGFGLIKKFQKQGEKYSLRVYGCYECSSMPNIGKPICKLDEGAFTAILQNKLKSQFIIEEKKCISMGEEYCEFEILEMKNESDSLF